MRAMVIFKQLKSSKSPYGSAFNEVIGGPPEEMNGMPIATEETFCNELIDSPEYIPLYAIRRSSILRAQRPKYAFASEVRVMAPDKDVLPG